MDEVETTRPKRLSLSQIVEMLLTRGGRSHSSVSISRNAKGDTQFEVQVAVGEDGVATLEDAEALALEVYDRLASTYPVTHGSYGGSGVDLTRNAKGETQISVSLKADAGATEEEYAAVVKQAIATYENTRMKFPLASGFVGAEGGAAVSRSEAS
jgi:hypothetical protein